MTCVAGIEHGGRVWLMGDSAMMYGDRVQIDSRPKVWRSAGMVFGISGSLRPTNRLMSACPPRWDGETEKVAWVEQVLVPAMASGMRYKEWEILVGIGGTLVAYAPGDGASGFKIGYGAVGNGGDAAEAALYALEKMHRRDPHSPRHWLTPAQKLGIALRASAEFCNKVRAPFRLVSTG